MNNRKNRLISVYIILKKIKHILNHIQEKLKEEINLKEDIIYN